MTVWPNGTKTKPYVSSAFGPRNINVPNASKNHKGTDFSHTFSIIRAVESGQVKVAGTPNGWSGGGRQVWVQHDGYFSKSLHASSLLVRDGQFVREGDPLCIMGETGTASDVHLHFEITPGNLHYSNTGQVNPVPFLAARIAGNIPAGGGAATPEEDDMPTMHEFLNTVAYDGGPTISQVLKDVHLKVNSLHDAVFKGGSSMPDNKRSIGQSLDGIVDVVDRIDARIVKDIADRNAREAAAER